MNEKCSRSWEVEAARGGRLSEAARALLEEHVARCETCARERRALEGLAGRLREGLPGAPDDLSVRRLRRATLERANAAWLDRGSPRERERGRRVTLAAAAIAFACALAGLAWWRPWSAGPSVQVTEGAAADWSRDSSAGAQRVLLREGAIELRTTREGSDPPFFVVVPDGEIQDVGTVFRVEVKGGVTTSIEVSEGAVVFRRPGQPEVRISAGEHWPHSDPASARAAAGAGGGGARGPGAASASAGDDREPAAGAGGSGDPAAPSGPVAPAGSSAGPSGSAASSAPKGAPAAAPKGATSAAPAGSAKAAASSKPATSSGMEEDIAYLQVIALMRDGRREEARLAAKNYLRRFPNGFRRVEVEAIAR